MTNLPMPRDPSYLTPEELAEADDWAPFVGRTVDTYSAGLGTVERTKGGIYVKVQLECGGAADCDAKGEAYLAMGAPGLCYVVNEETGEFVADLRNQHYVCDKHAGAKT